MTTGWPVDAAPDPAPGDPSAVRSMANCAGRAAEQLNGSAVALRWVAADDALWTGAAAAAFRDRLGALPGDLARAADALADVERALVGYAAVLEQAQARAGALAAQWRATALQGAARGQATVAAQAAAFLLRVDALAQEMDGASRRAEAAVHQAAAAAPRDPGWLTRLAHSVDQAVGDFVQEHAAAISLALDVLSFVQGALAFTPLAPYAVALTAVTVGATLVLARYGQASQADVVMAVAGPLLGPAARAVGSARVATTAVALAPKVAKTAVARGVAVGQPVATTALKTADEALTGYNNVTGAWDMVTAVRDGPTRQECAPVVPPGPLRRAPRMPAGAP